MPVFKRRIAFDIARNVRASLALHAGVVRSAAPEFDPYYPPEAATGKASREADAKARREIAQLRQRLLEREKESEALQEKLDSCDKNLEPARIAPDRIVWTFGSGRTGSSWLNVMLRDPAEHTAWGEPLVGKLFADLYYGQTGRQQSEVEHFVLSRPYEGTWLNSIRNFVLDGATARFPEIIERGYLMVTEPNGSTGAPLLMEALPESRMILLLRDPRDVVASFLAASRQGSWLHSWNAGDSQREPSLADSQPDLFVRQRAGAYMQHMGKAKEAYDNHRGPKVLIRYEDLRYDTLNVMKHLYSALQIPMSEAELSRTIDKHSWKNIPAEQKGENKFFRKARPGGWQDDLTPGQARIVEQITAPVIGTFYFGKSDN